MEDIDLSKNTLFLRMMPRIDYNRKRGSLRSVSGWVGEGSGGEGGGGLVESVLVVDLVLLNRAVVLCLSLLSR